MRAVWTALSSAGFCCLQAGESRAGWGQGWVLPFCNKTLQTTVCVLVGGGGSRGEALTCTTPQ